MNAELRPLTTLLLLGACATPTVEEAPSASEVDVFAPLVLPTPNAVRTASGAPGSSYWQQRVDYTLDVVLDVESNRLSGAGRVSYHNNSPDTLDYLWLTLEQEAFRADGLAEVMAPAWEPMFEEGVEAGYELELSLTNGAPLELSRYETLGRVELPTPLAPGASFEFEMQWSFAIMTESALRLGLEVVEDGRTLELAQWFPALCVYDDVHGWNTLPFLRTGEFYTDFGDYEVRIQVPREFVVAATGELQNAQEVLPPLLLERLEEARSTPETTFIIAPDEIGSAAIRPAGEGALVWHFAADDVRTFAFAATDACIWDASSTDAGVLCQSLYPREGLPHWRLSTDMLRWSVEFYSKLWMPYPYPVAINVNGAEYGMEYPMIAFSGSRSSEHDVFSLTTHELAHNWFPMVVNTDERRHAWMDEGFNTFGNVLAVAERYPGFDFYAEIPDFAADQGEFADLLVEARGVAVDTPHDSLPDEVAGFLAYDKPGMALLLLRSEVLGPERFDAAFQEYVRRWAFHAPRPADFFRCMEDAAGADLSWFWRGWFVDAPLLDYAVGEPAWRAGRARLPIERIGGMVMPLRFRVTYPDGSSEERRVPAEVWSRGDTYVARWSCEQAPVHVELDPEHRLPDSDRSNDVWPAQE